MTHPLDDLLAPDSSIREIGPALYSALDPDDVGAPFDARAAGYDRMVSNQTYLRVAWGLTRGANDRFIREAFDDGGGAGTLLDVAAGSCVDSAAVYAATTRPTIVLDRSVAMLERGRERLKAIAGTVPDHVVFLHADAAATPLRAGAVETMLCQGAYHLFPETAKIVAEWSRVVRDGGGVFVSALTRGRWLGDRYLGLLHRAGEIAEPRSAPEFASRLEAELGADVAFEVMGNFTYARARRPEENPS